LQLVVELGSDQMNLAKIGLVGIAGNTRSVLHLLAQMGVTLDAEPSQQPDRSAVRLGEPVITAAADP
jgi:hypothetical protein